jgi:hypothetical protein
VFQSPRLVFFSAARLARKASKEAVVALITCSRGIRLLDAGRGPDRAAHVAPVVGVAPADDEGPRLGAEPRELAAAVDAALPHRKEPLLISMALPYSLAASTTARMSTG